MDDDNNFFAVPSGGEQFPEVGDSPIILGGAPPEETIYLGEPPAEEPAYLGDINEAPPGDDAILLGPSDDMMAPPENAGPSPMQKWNDEWQVTLQARKDEENARKGELVEAARVALEQFQAERELKREAKMTKNREDEQAKLEAIEADLENDNSWQRVCKLVELSHDSTKSAQDVKRMRDVMIFLKNDKAKAVALA